jgi:hypothetical protein
MMRSVRGRVLLAAITLILMGAVTAIAIVLATGFSEQPPGRLTTSSGRSCTLTASTKAPGGTLTVCAQYSVSGPGPGLVHLRSVVASYRSPGGYTLPKFTVTLANAETGELEARLSSPVDEANAVRSYRSDFTGFNGAFRTPETMVVTVLVTAIGPSGGPVNLPVASVALVLSRQAFPCPNPGTMDGSSIPDCGM